MPDLSPFRPYLEFINANPVAISLIVAILFALVILAFLRHSGAITETFFRSYLFWTVMLLFARDAVRLGAFGPDAAAVVGVSAPDLQAAYLSLGFAIVAFLAIGGSAGLRLAAIIGIALSLLGPYATGIPTVEMVKSHIPEVAVVAVGILLFVMRATGILNHPRRDTADAII